MYVPKPFVMTDPADKAALIRTESFGMLVTHGPDGLRATHLPFLYDETAGDHGALTGHIARANPQSADLGPEREALAVFTGAHGYISPTWYETTDAVPTWNYVAVHVSGAFRLPVLKRRADAA